MGKVFQVSYSDVNPEILLINEDQIVTLTYIETTEVVVSMTAFDIFDVVLEEGSVTQAAYVESQINIDEETERISDREELDGLINSDEMQGIDPDALKEFLAEQTAQQNNEN